MALTCRSGKSTHISTISNSVTHLQSYTNSAITGIAGNSVPDVDNAMPSPGIDASNANIAKSSADVAASSADIGSLNGDCFMMFHNILSVSFHDFLLVVLCFTCFTSLSLSFTSFS